MRSIWLCKMVAYVQSTASLLMLLMIHADAASLTTDG